MQLHRDHHDHHDHHCHDDADIIAMTKNRGAEVPKKVQAGGEKKRGGTTRKCGNPSAPHVPFAENPAKVSKGVLG